MRKNRKMSRRLSVVTVHFMHMGAVLLMLFVMVIMNLIASSSCRQQERIRVAKEETLKKLEDELHRETMRWEEMKTSERLEAALVKHGLSMHYPNASQIVRMRADGRPYPGQLSLAKAAQREKGVATANYPRRGKRRR